MGWSELRAIPNEYNEEIRRIDEQIVGLISSRLSLTQGRRFYPSAEQIEEWTQLFGMEETQIRMILHQLQPQIRPQVMNDTGPLLSVVPIMKKTVVDSCEYTITHAMRHERASVVFLDIRLQTEEPRSVYLKPNLTLEVIGDQPYSVQRHGNRGGGAHSEMQFMVAPPLPESLDGIAFSLVPSAVFLDDRTKEIILDKQVDFE